jgi:lipopolysaccharide assembly outer membrane protein LptD (OstA)
MAWGLGGADFDELIASASVTPPGFGPLSRSLFRLGYRYLRVPPDIATVTQDDLSQLDFGVRFRLAERLQLGYGATYSLDDSEFLTQVGSVIYASGCRCFAVGFDLGVDRQSDLFVRLRYSIVGLGGDALRDPFAAAAGWIGSRDW